MKSFILMYQGDLPSEVSLQLKNHPKNIYRSKCPKSEFDIIFNRPCLFTSNALIKLEQHMLLYEECFNTGVSIYISCIMISTFTTIPENRFAFLRTDFTNINNN